MLMDLKLGEQGISKIMLGTDTIYDSSEWKLYPGALGLVFYRFKSDNIIQIYGFARSKDGQSDGLYLKPISGIKFTSWAITGSDTITGYYKDPKYAGGVTAQFSLSEQGLSSDKGGLGLFLGQSTETAKMLGHELIYPVEINIEKE